MPLEVALVGSSITRMRASQGWVSVEWQKAIRPCTICRQGAYWMCFSFPMRPWNTRTAKRMRPAVQRLFAGNCSYPRDALQCQSDKLARRSGVGALVDTHWEVSQQSGRTLAETRSRWT